jgi:hypothetical protein
VPAPGEAKKCPSCSAAISPKHFVAHVETHILNGEIVAIDTWLPNRGSTRRYFRLGTPDLKAQALDHLETQQRLQTAQGGVVKWIDARAIRKALKGSQS